MDIIRVLDDCIDACRVASAIEPKDEIFISALRWEVYRSLQDLLDAMAMIISDMGLRRPGGYSEIPYYIKPGWTARSGLGSVSQEGSCRKKFPSSFLQENGC